MEIFAVRKLLCATFHAMGFFVLSMSGASALDSHEHSGATEPSAAEQSFVAENTAAMKKMMVGMDAKSTGDVNRDFVVSMSAHHQGAIDMAVTMLKYGTNEQLKRMAQEIIVSQQQEIAAMHQAIGDPLPPSAISPTQLPVSRP